MKQTQIDFKFSKNWKKFFSWYNSTRQKGVVASGAPWKEQKEVIKATFELTAPNIVDWKQVWIDFEDWYEEVLKRKSLIVWQEQKNQIETLMLNTLKKLNDQTFVLAYLDKGTPSIDPEKYTYWEAIEIKKEMDGNGNGEGGNQNVDKVTIINLAKLIK